MMTGDLFQKLTVISVFLVTFLVLVDSQVKKCAGDREVTFHKTLRTFDVADQSCRKLGGSLLKVDNVEITNMINSKLRPNEKYYIGLRWVASRKLWVWRDGIGMADKIGYQPWLPNEPNGADEDCVAVGVDSRGNKGWFDISCNRGIYYVCQKDITNKLTLAATASTITMSNAGPRTITCRETSCLSSTVTWYYRGSAVTQSRSSSVYQSKVGESAELVLRNLKIGDSGRTYRCRAIASGKQGDQRDITVTVIGYPNILSSTAVACAPNITVSWTAHSLALGYLHKLKLNSYASRNVFNTTPTSVNQITTTFANLLPSTRYTIKILACKNAACTSNYARTRSIATNGVPNPITNAELENNYDVLCRLTWQAPAFAGDPIVGYVISLILKIASTRTANETRETQVFNTTGTSYDFVPLPNRNYSAMIRSVACGGESSPVLVSGTCSGSPQAPAGLKSPSVSVGRKELLRDVTIEVPDEANGSMSCLFVIISNESSVGNETGNQTEYTFDKLLMINSSESPTNSSESSNGEYIAVAIPASRFALKTHVTETIGDNSISSCNFYESRHEITVNGNDTSVITWENGTVFGRNKPLLKDGLYRVFVVASVPNGQNILISESPSTNFNTSDSLDPTAEDSAGNVGATVGSICGVVIVLLLPIVFFLLYKKRRDAKNWDSMKTSLQNAQPAARGGLEQPNIEREDEDEGRVQVSVNRGGNGDPNSAYANYAPVLHNEASFRISQIDQVYSTKRSRNNAGFSEEFQNIVVDSAQFEGAKIVASSDHLKSKNRYKNILPFDANRVILETGDSDYINASYVRGCDQNDKYIATQGPLAGTVDDFWLMVFEQNSSIIVMLTKAGCEAGKKKCESYWPESEKHQTYGCVTVQNIQELSYGAYICRTFGISFAGGGDKAEIRCVQHYQFLKWPDHGVPQTTSALVRMHRAIAHDYAEAPANGPIIVHCSAGAGRTGTFIGYDILMNEMRIKSRIDFFKCVMDMRKQRVDMVQNGEQYVLLHKLVLEYYLFDETDCFPEDAKNKFDQMCSPGGNDVVLKEFEDLDKVEPMKNAKNIGLLERNKAFNRHGNELPYDYSRVKMMMYEDETEAPYLNASWIESYGDDCRMIAAQGLTDASIAVFWRTVVSNDVRSIVMLTSLVEDSKEQCVQYWPSAPGEKFAFNHISVTLIGHRAHGAVVERTLDVADANKGRSFQVTQLHYTDWQQGSNPESEKDVIGLIVRMQEILQQTANSAALIHCSDGTGRTGTFCAIVNLIDRLKRENRIDVFRTVKDLRDGRPNMVKTLDQYKYCYQAIVHYLKSFELYANF